MCAPSEYTSVCDEPQPCTKIRDCPTGPLQMVGPTKHAGSEGQTSHPPCPENYRQNKSPKILEENYRQNKSHQEENYRQNKNHQSKSQKVLDGGGGRTEDGGVEDGGQRRMTPPTPTPDRRRARCASGGKPPRPRESSDGKSTSKTIRLAPMSQAGIGPHSVVAVQGNTAFMCLPVGDEPSFPASS